MHRTQPVPLLFLCRIPNLDRSCQGVYTCRATSPSGEAQHSAKLVIQGKAGPGPERLTLLPGAAWRLGRPLTALPSPPQRCPR